MEVMAQFNSQDREGVVTEDEFIQVQKALSGAITDSAEYFRILKGCWNA